MNVASGFYHDHLFVPDGEEEVVMGLLAGLAESVTRSSDEEDSEAATEHTEEGGHNQDIVVAFSQSDEEAE